MGSASGANGRACRSCIRATCMWRADDFVRMYMVGREGALACLLSLTHTYRHTQPSKHIRIHGRWWLMAAHACTYESHAHGGIVPYVCTALSCISLVALFAVSTCCTSSGFQGQLGNRGRRGTVGIREDQKLDYAKCRWCC